MSTMSTVTPAASKWLDFEAEAQQATSQGVKDFFWPVTLPEIRQVRDIFARNLVAAIGARNPGQDATALYLWLALPYLVGECVETFVACALAQRLATRDRLPRCGQEPGKWAALAAGEAPPPSQALQRLRRGYREAALWRRLGRSVAGMFMQDGLSRRPIRLASNEDAFTFSATPLIVSTAGNRARRVILDHLSQWFPAGRLAVDHVSCDAAFVDEAVALLCDAMTTVDVQASDTARRHLSSAFAELAAISGAYLDTARRRAASAPLEFWAGTLGHLGNRAVCRAIHERGGRTVVFDHGTGSGWWSLPIRTLIDFDLADEMVTYTAAHAEGTAQSIDPDMLVRPSHRCKFSAAPSSSMPALPSSARPAPDRANRTVMYVTTVLGGEKIEFEPLPSDVSQIDWQARLIDHLVAKGWRVIIKPHPDSKAGIPETLLKSPGVTLRTELFETISGEADLLLFDWPQSTAFRNALPSDTPIVYVDFAQIPIADAAAPLFDRRVARVTGSIDRQNRLQVSWTELDTALEAAPQKRDSAFARAYFGF
jgi:hypothetical protein